MLLNVYGVLYEILSSLGEADVYEVNDYRFLWVFLFSLLKYIYTYIIQVSQRLY